MKTIELIYKRPPNRVNHFQQRLLYEDKDVIITTQRVKPSNPIVIDGVTVLGDDFPVVWFVFADKWYDVGKVYNLKEQITATSSCR
jgi:predicted RNA-binding protein associated with RNAse of E/G family